MNEVMIILWELTQHYQNSMAKRGRSGVPALRDPRHRVIAPPERGRLGRQRAYVYMICTKCHDLHDPENAGPRIAGLIWGETM